MQYYAFVTKTTDIQHPRSAMADPKSTDESTSTYYVVDEVKVSGIVSDYALSRIQLLL